MKRQLLVAIAMGLVLVLPTNAWACTTVRPKTWTGSIQLARPSMGTSNTVFSQSCTWPDSRLNGHDGIVFDVHSHRGLAGKATWTTSAPVKPDSLFGYFRTKSCAITGGTWTQAKSGSAVSFTIPKDAKWLIVQPVTTMPSRDIKVTVTSPGRKCR